MSQVLSDYLMMPEQDCVRQLVEKTDWDYVRAQRISKKAQGLVESLRAAPRKAGSIENFFQTYGLNSQEGIALMCLAEALLRLPDSKTASALIKDKLSRAKWMAAAKGEGQDWMMRMAGLGLFASQSTLEGPLSKLGEPVIRKAMMEGMKILGGQFVLGQSAAEAMKNAATLQKEKGYLFSYDMLGEGARTDADAEQYFKAYERAIEDIGAARGPEDIGAPGISVKLSALHPRFSVAQEAQCVPALIQKLQSLCRTAAQYGLCLTVDAEESERLEISLKIITAIIEDVSLRGWDGFGLAVQAYGKRAYPLIESLISLAQHNNRKIQIRLVKGAYWDSEIKRAQMKGLQDYPVFTRKLHTDVSYLACAQKLLGHRDAVYPMFGTHNAYTVSAILDMAGDNRDGFEFQRLFGMGEMLYDKILGVEKVPVRIYAPVGVHRDLLPYLVRRLLENGANSSFVNKVFDASVPPSDLAFDVFDRAQIQKYMPHPSIPLPSDIYDGRLNAMGHDLDDAPTLQGVLTSIEKAHDRREITCASIIGGHAEKSGNSVEITSPADEKDVMGTCYMASADTVSRAFTLAQNAWPAWNKTPARGRAEILNKIADMYEERMPELMALCIHEAGKTIPDAMAEVREAIDFCRYYAALGMADFDSDGVLLKSYTGESNRIRLEGRGVFVCISPWNFPLAIFTGQVVAALMAGNCVLAKPAEQTPFVAQRAVNLMRKAGVPEDVLHLITGDGRVGEMMTSHPHVAGVAFTGSTQAAQSINRTLAGKDGAIVPLIAETGGQNAMIADSSALPEQVVDDVIVSAFGSAGQRCSAARILFVQEDIADKVIAMLKGAMQTLRVGNPQYYATDIGPVIDEEAMANLQHHKSTLEALGKFIAQVPLAEDLARTGHYFAPVAYEIPDISLLTKEVFGPVLHVVRFAGGDIPALISDLNKTGYGLTFGVHTRIDNVAKACTEQVMAGNVYINRSMIGAVVGVQPFGGQGLSGTGPKAGGPHYLHRFATEKTVSVNTTASGGNTSLVMLSE